MGVEDLRQDLQGIDDARAGAADVGARVHGVDPALTYRRKRVPARISLEDREVAERALRAEAAAGEHDDFGLCLHDALPGDPYRVLPLPAERLRAPGKLDQLGHPVAAAEGRIDPLQHQAARPGTGTG